MKQERIYLQELICYWLTALVCVVVQLCLSNLATSVVIHGTGPHQHPKLLPHPQTGFGLYPCKRQGCQLRCRVSPQDCQSPGENKAPISLCTLLYLCVLPLPKQTLKAREKKLLYMHISFPLQEHHPTHWAEDLCSRADLGSSYKQGV